MSKWALFKDADWIRDVEAESEEEALKMDHEATRVELISEADNVSRR